MFDHPILLVEEVSWRTPAGDTVLDRVSLALHREKTGLVGANGCGKTTLLRILTGDLALSAGRVRRAGRIAVLPQNFRPMQEQTVVEALGVREKLDALCRLTAGHGSDADLAVLDDDWAIEERIAAELSRLGLSHIGLDRPLASLSGGETTRVVLASLFLRRPDLLLLDEPTNNLDRESRQALQAALAEWRGGLVVVSHDRALLRLMDRMVELTPKGPKSYGGNYDLYVAQRDAEAQAAQEQLAAAEKELRRVRRDAQASRERQDRRNSRGAKERDKGGIPKILLNAMRETSTRTTARLGATHDGRIADAQDALAEARERVEQSRELAVCLALVDLPAGKLILEMEGVCFRYPDSSRPLFDRFALRMMGPERVAIAGPNGSGKTTLLKLIAGELTPDAGTVRLGVHRWRCLDQRADLLIGGLSVLENFRRHAPAQPETACRMVLAHFLFRGDTVYKPAAALSGGEHLRAALACLLSATEPPQLLLLDEPTNHLDLPSLANLELALSCYTGALVVISHDRDFLDAVGVDRVIELGAGSADCDE
jgi:ATPase subunit of ABC transporter with duplicated ATPase domains